MSEWNADALPGCLLGGALGDAMGAPYEFREDAKLSPPLLPERITDDTQLILATCEAIIDSGGVVSPEAIAAEMCRWFSAGKVRRAGASTTKAMRELEVGGHWALVGRKGEYAAGAGAAMRAAPLGFFVDPDDGHARRTIRDVSRITHHNEEAYVGALAVVYAVRRLAAADWPLDDDLAGRLVDVLPDTRVRDRLLQFADARPSIEQASEYGVSGYVVDVVPLAVVTAQRAGHVGFTTAIERVIACGGDTDTNAAIAGQLIGAAVGRDALPDKLIEQFEQRAMVVDLAKRLEMLLADGTNGSL